MERVGLYTEVVKALQAVDDLVRIMRVDIAYPGGVFDEDSAVKRYLMHLSMLVDVVLNDIAMSDVASNDVMVSMKLRMLIEYATKSAYFNTIQITRSTR